MENLMRTIPFLDLRRQYESIKDEIDAAIRDVVTESAFVGGPVLDRFEHAFAAFCRAKYCVGVGNGTDAIALTLRAFGIGPGDEVIIPANTFIATSEAVTLTGARVVFADIDPTTYNIDPRQIEAKVTSHTRAVIAVHLYGRAAEMDSITAITKRHNLLLIEDAAQAHGAMYHGHRIGSIGDAACFSFYPGKNLGAYGDGGAVVTSDEAVAAKIRMLANHGRIDKYDHGVEGVNSRLDGLQAAVLEVKLKHLDRWNELRRDRARRYSEMLAGTPVVVPTETPGVLPVFHLYVVRVAAIRNSVRDHLHQHGISTGVHYPIALPNLKAYRHMGHQPQDFPEATSASQEVLSLPIYAELQDGDLECVCETLIGCVSSASVT
jgi:dTDP-4-amino-4,6-dideoxygalactose transaminase